MNKKLAPVLENITESTAACIITMAQGNILGISLGHWIIASQTGVLAGALASAVIFAARTERRGLVAVLLGLATALVDFLVHPGGFGPLMFEAIVTGVGAGMLSWLAGTGFDACRRRFAAASGANTCGKP